MQGIASSRKQLKIKLLMICTTKSFFFHSQPCRVEFQRTQANQLRSKQVIDKRNPEIQIRLKSCSHR